MNTEDGSLGTTADTDTSGNAASSKRVGRRRDKSPANPRFQLAEESRIRAKKDAAEKQRLLSLRTGSLYNFIGASLSAERGADRPASPSPEKLPSVTRQQHDSPENHDTARTGATCNTVGVRRAPKRGKPVPSVGRASRTEAAIPGRARGINESSGRRNTGCGTQKVLPSNWTPSVDARNRDPAPKQTRLQQTLHRYSYFADPVTSQMEALRSLQAKNSLYPTLRFSQPWDEKETDPLDEYMSSSSAASSSAEGGEDLARLEDGTSGGECRHGDKGGARRIGVAVGTHICGDVRAMAPAEAPIGVTLELAEKRRELRQHKRELRRRRQRMTQARREFNASVIAAEAAVRERESAVLLAETIRKKEAAGRRPPQVDVLKLAHFRYSKIKETLPLDDSEQGWNSDGLYLGSSAAVSQPESTLALPSEFYPSGARPRFYDLYRLVHRQKDTVDDDDLLEEEELTPRRLFLRDLMARGVAPSATIMRSKADPFSLDLGYQGLGDAIGLSLAAALPHLPLVMSLSLRDNRLTDISLEPLIAEAIRLESLTSLDLSSNKIDNSAIALRAYVASSRCTIQKLSLSHADVDDDECKALMETLATNFSVTALDLSHNMIGEKETYNFIRPDYTTGGEAAAEMLEMMEALSLSFAVHEQALLSTMPRKQMNVTLSILDLSWNSVRMASGVALGKSMAHNSALMELRLAHNSLADEGCQELAQSLRTNRTLRLLDISFNNLKPRSAMVLANALLDNTSLDHLMMSHNNVGRSGARAVFMALRQRARPGVALLVDMQSCELGSDAGEELFNMYSPSGRYELDLSKPYDYMVGRTLLGIANRSEGCELSDVEHITGERGTWKTIALARRSLASSPSSPSSRATTTITVSIDSDKDTTDGSRRAESSPQFGERILGSGVAGFGGDWRIPVETLLSRCLADREACKEACTGGGRGEVKEREKAEAEAGNEGALSRRMDVAEPADIKLFFRELGFEPTGSISTRICKAFNAARGAERGLFLEQLRPQNGGDRSATGGLLAPERGEERVQGREDNTISQQPLPTYGEYAEMSIAAARIPRTPRETSLLETNKPSEEDGESQLLRDRPSLDASVSDVTLSEIHVNGSPVKNAAGQSANRDHVRSPGEAVARSVGANVDNLREGSGSLSRGHGEPVNTPFEIAKHLFELVFFEADTDMSGCIDHREFVGLLRELGRDVGEDVAQHCLASYDIDRSGTVEAGEFVDFMTHEFLAPAPAPPGVMCEASASQAWKLPREGRLRMTVVADFVAPARVEVASQESVDALISNIRFSAKTEQDRLEMFQLATEGTDFYMTSLNAQGVIDEWNNGINIVGILETMLPQMSSDRNVVSLVENNLTYAQKLELRSRLGQAWGPLVGNPTGSYCLDLSNRRHLVAARRLAMINYTEKAHGMSGAAGRHDTSQERADLMLNNSSDALNTLKRGATGTTSGTKRSTASPSRVVGSTDAGSLRCLVRARYDSIMSQRHVRFQAQDLSAIGVSTSMTNCLVSVALFRLRPVWGCKNEQLLDHLDLGDMQRSSEHQCLFQGFVVCGGDSPSTGPTPGDGPTVSNMLSVPLQGSGSPGTPTAEPGAAQHHRQALNAKSTDRRTTVAPRAVEPGKSSQGASRPPLARASTFNVGRGKAAGLLPGGDVSDDAAMPARVAGERLLRTGVGTSAGASQADDRCKTGRDRRGIFGKSNNELEKRCELEKVHGLIKAGELRPITPDQILSFHADYQVSSKAERRRAWAIMELGQPLVPDEELKVEQGRGGGGKGGGGGGIAGRIEPSGQGTAVGADVNGESADASSNLLGKKSDALHDNVDGRSKSGEEPIASQEQQNGEIATQAEIPILADAKPNFGDKQKPLYLTPLKWRKLIGRPQFPQDYKTASSKLCELRVQMLHHWLTVEQAIVTINMFPRCDFLRVVVATTLFGRLIDLDNLGVLLDELTQAEVDEFLWRVGPLNCYNPMKPDRFYDLDLTHRDDREVCKVLAKLAVDEPGENWVEEEYCWSFAQRPVPGWELPMSWTTPDTVHNGGPRHFGRLTLTYSSDPAKGCAPKWKLREELTAHMLVGGRQTL